MNLDNKKPGRKPLYVYYIIAAVIIILLNVLLLPAIEGRKVQTTDYSTFLTGVEKDYVKTVEIQDDYIYYVAESDGQEGYFRTVKMNDPDLVDRLHDANVKFGAAAPQQTSIWISLIAGYVLPIAIFILLGRWLSKKMMSSMGGGPGGAMSFGKSNAKVYVKSSTGIKFSDVAGEDEAKDLLTEIVDYLHNPQKYREIGASMPKGALLVGPPGTGKTLLAKEISNIVVKDTDMIRLDMSEFKEEHSISKIIGSPPGYVGFENKNTILDKIKENSNAVILLDEIEKAHPSVVNLFLQALDEGIMKTSTNEVIRLYNNIIIMTSNIGYKKNQVGFNEKSQNIITNEIKETLGIEFVNRIDKVLIFDRLNEESIKKIILKEIDKLRDNFNLDKKRLIIKPQVIENIIQETKYKEFGARRVEKIIKDKLYDTVIDEMLNKSVKITIETI